MSTLQAVQLSIVTDAVSHLQDIIARHWCVDEVTTEIHLEGHSYNWHVWQLMGHYHADILARGLFIERGKFPRRDVALDLEVVLPFYREGIDELGKESPILTMDDIVAVAKIAHMVGIFVPGEMTYGPVGDLDALGVEIRKVDHRNWDPETDEVTVDLPSQSSTLHTVFDNEGHIPDWELTEDSLVHECLGPFWFRGEDFWVSFGARPHKDL